MALDWCQNFVNAQYLVDQLMDYDKILKMHWYWQNVHKDNYKLFFIIFQLSFSPWLMSEFRLCSISWELICGFWSKFVYALILTRCRFGWLNNIFCSFSTELWPLIDVEILYMLNILWTSWWILIKFCKCIDTDKMYVRTITNYFSLFFNWVIALDWCQNFVYAQYLGN